MCSLHVKSSLIVMTTIVILFSSLVTTAEFPRMTRVLAYENSQAASLANECSGEQNSGTICVNDSPLIQGDKNTVNTPISSQISNPVEQGPPGPQGPKGDTGPAGPAGPAFVPTIYRVNGPETTNIAGTGFTDPSTAECDDGDLVTGGGHRARVLNLIGEPFVTLFQVQAIPG